MTYAELSTALFSLTPRNPIRDYIRMGDWPVIPAGIAEIEEANLEPIMYHVWADPQRKVIYVYWPEYAVAMDDLAVDGIGHKEFRDIILKVWRGKVLTDAEIKILGDPMNNPPPEEAWAAIERRMKKLNGHEEEKK